MRDALDQQPCDNTKTALLFGFLQKSTLRLAHRSREHHL